MRLRLVAALVTQVIHLLQALVVAIMRKRRKAGKSAGAPEDAGLGLRETAAAVQALKDAGVSDGMVSCTTVYDVASGHAFNIYEIGRWGSDPSRIEVLGRGATLQDAVSEWRRGMAAKTRRRWSGHG